jgi:hypothetical protein
LKLIYFPILICLLSYSSPAQAIDPAIFQKLQPGMWSANAAYLWPGPTAIKDLPEGGRNLAVVSPNGQLMIEVKNSELAVVRTTDGSKINKKEIGVESLAEILWAPDSTAFVITSSDGGYVGTWSVSLHRIRENDIAISDPGTLALSDFKRYFSRKPMKSDSDCPNEYPNVVAVGWVDGSHKLLLAVEMPCHSGCEYMCNWLGYIVNADQGNIQKRLNALETQSTWKSLVGPRLKGQ